MAQPYTVRYPLQLNNSYEWWEYNCHEGNRTIRDYINGSRKPSVVCRSATPTRFRHGNAHENQDHTRDYRRRRGGVHGHDSRRDS